MDSSIRSAIAGSRRRKIRRMSSMCSSVAGGTSCSRSEAALALDVLAEAQLPPDLVDVADYLAHGVDVGHPLGRHRIALRRDVDVEAALLELVVVAPPLLDRAEDAGVLLGVGRLHAEPVLLVHEEA